MSHRRKHVLIWVVAALVAAGQSAACGRQAAGVPAASSGPTHAAAASQGAPAQAVSAAARAYLVSRDLAALAGGATGGVQLLQPGSPAAAAEPLVATGRAIVAAGQGGLFVAARTTLAAGPVAFFQGTGPVTASHLSFGGDAVTRAEIVCRVSSVFTAADGRRHAAVVDHALTLLGTAAGKWLVYEDDYADPLQAEALSAAGAPMWQVRAARQRVADLARVRLASETAAGAVRAFVSLLNAGRYVEAGFCLEPGFGTARAMGATLRSVHIEAMAPSTGASATRGVLRIVLRVRPRLALWNAGLNVRFVTLQRPRAGDPWRISAIDTGP